MKSVSEKIAKAIAESIDGCEGRFDLDVELDENTFVTVSGWYEFDGYREDDYFNGTGAWVTTYARVSVDACEVCAYGENGDEVPTTIEIDTAEIERFVEDIAA